MGGSGFDSRLWHEAKDLMRSERVIIRLKSLGLYSLSEHVVAQREQTNGVTQPNNVPIQL